MRPKSMVLILIALGCGLIASIGISQVMERNAGDKAKLPTAQIYVAVVDVSAGEQLSAAKIKLEEWPVDKIPEGAVKTPEQLEGMAPMQPLYAGEPLLVAKLADHKKMKGNASRIRQGYRVMAVNVDAASAVAGLVWPGDHVDVMAYTRGSNSIGDRAEAILENVEVFAVNDKINRHEDGDGRSIQARTVSLLVTREQAEQLMLFQHVGLMSLALRNPDDEEKVASKSPNLVPPVAEISTPVASGLEALKSLLPPGGMSLLGGPPEEPMVTMDIIEGGTGKVNRFTWDDRNGLPRELREAVDKETSDQLPDAINLNEVLPETPADNSSPVKGTAPVAPPSTTTRLQ
jgi:pilus assembly protein CpaB